MLLCGKKLTQSNNSSIVDHVQQYKARVLCFYLDDLFSNLLVVKF